MNIVGVVIRYYIYGLQKNVASNVDIETLHKQKKQNPGSTQIVGTLSLLCADEKVVTTPVGRLMVSNQPTILCRAERDRLGVPEPGND